MRDCPVCSKPVDGLSCVHCGWGNTNVLPSKPTLDPLRYCCQFESEGQRCANPGALSPGIRGEGPWYCRQHYDLVIKKHRPGIPVAAPQVLPVLRGLLERLQDR